MTSLFNLVDSLKEKCTKAYWNGVAFIIDILKTQAEKLDLLTLYFRIMQTIQINKGKTNPSSTPIPSPLPSKHTNFNGKAP